MNREISLVTVSFAMKKIKFGRNSGKKNNIVSKYVRKNLLSFFFVITQIIELLSNFPQDLINLKLFYCV